MAVTPADASKTARPLQDSLRAPFKRACRGRRRSGVGDRTSCRAGCAAEAFAFPAPPCHPKKEKHIYQHSQSFSEKGNPTKHAQVRPLNPFSIPAGGGGDTNASLSPDRSTKFHISQTWDQFTSKSWEAGCTSHMHRNLRANVNGLNQIHGALEVKEQETGT